VDVSKEKRYTIPSSPAAANFVPVLLNDNKETLSFTSVPASIVIGYIKPNYGSGKQFLIFFPSINSNLRIFASDQNALIRIISRGRKL
jgi:hypothetical protein